MNKRLLILWVPLIAYLVFLVVASLGLNRDPQTVLQSRMIGKAVPGIDLPAASSTKPALSTKQMADGKPRLLNVFASWCVPCAAEAPQRFARIEADQSRETVWLEALAAVKQKGWLT